jgi:hypothetical protein
MDAISAHKNIQNALLGGDRVQQNLNRIPCTACVDLYAIKDIGHGSLNAVQAVAETAGSARHIALQLLRLITNKQANKHTAKAATY